MNKIVFVLGAIALLATATMLFQTSSNVSAEYDATKRYTHLTEEVIGLWTLFKKTHNKEYKNSSYEVYRMQVFLDTLNFIHENQGETYTLGITSLADITAEEFKANYLGYVAAEEQEQEIEEQMDNIEYPASVNWVQSGIVPPILNQASCGSCWAFSAAGSLSMAYNLKQGGNSVQLSPEQLVQCSKSYGNNGCSGGLMNNAFNYAMKFPLATNAQYPYTSGAGVTGTCNTSLQSQG